MTADVSQARDWATALIQRESRGTGDTENAMHRLERKYGIPWRTFWTLRYRPPTDILTGAYERLRLAYLTECERQERRLRHEIEITKATAGASHPLVVAAQAVVGAEKVR